MRITINVRPSQHVTTKMQNNDNYYNTTVKYFGENEDIK